MKKTCGLLGRALGHSYSPLIHSYLGDYSYELFECEPEKVGEFMRTGCYDAINVTVPYKTAVIPYLDELSDTARKTGSVNTVVRTEDGRLFGDNTDYFGFCYMLRRADIGVKGKKCLVLGSGGSSLTVRCVLADLGAREVRVISRTGEDNYENISRHYDAQIIVNTTPVGMYPSNGTSPLSLEGFTGLEGVADIIFNPHMTELLYQADALGVRCTGGLSMLVAQAKAASERFIGNEIPDEKIGQILSAIESVTENIILVGMPGCGKSKISRALGRILGREVIDTDGQVEKTAGKSIPDIFREEGEEAFRAYEHTAVCEAGKKSGVIIATGGGAVTRINNVKPLRQNGRVVFLRRPINELSRGGRPLSLGADLEEMYRVRRPFYEGCADITVDVRENPEATARAVIDALNIQKPEYTEEGRAT